MLDRLLGRDYHCRQAHTRSLDSLPLGESTPPQAMRSHLLAEVLSVLGFAEWHHAGPWGSSHRGGGRGKEVNDAPAKRHEVLHDVPRDGLAGALCRTG